MRIAILTVGSRGDVQPYVALGLGLRRAGYDARIATHAEFREFVTGYGLDFAVIEGNPRQMMETDTGQMWLASGHNPIAFMRGFMALAGPIAERLLATSWEACQGADAVLFSAIGFSGYHVAEKLEIPSMSAALQPLTPTRYFPSVGTPPHPRLGGIYNRLTHEIYQQVFWQLLRPYINPWRRDVLKLDPMPWHGPYRRLARERLPFVYGYSPLVAPKPPDWGEWVHVCGYWFLDGAGSYQPPPRLVDFLESGPPPVYIGFGSMIHRDPEQVAEMFVTALARSKQRGILLAGWGGLNHANLPDHVLSIDFVPHDWLFPRMAAIVHHGGAGTTAAALRSGARRSSPRSSPINRSGRSVCTRWASGRSRSRRSS